MTDIKAQFKAAATREHGYVAASLNFMAADTRNGLSDSAVADFAVIKKYAAEHPCRSGVAHYVAKTEKALQEKTLKSRPSLKM
jgi:hypothetical protein